MTNRTRPGRRNRMRAALAATSTGAERAVYMALESYADASGVAWPSRATIADLTGYSVGAVKKAVSRLREVGLVESVQVIRRGGIVGCRYWLTTYDDGTGSPLVEVGPRSEVEVEVEHQDAAAARALQVMSDLPLPRTEILDLLRQIGSGDSWAGLMASRTALERSFEGARVPGAVLRARLRQVVVRPSAGSGALGVGCSVCDRGFVELPDGRLRRCEVCHTRRVLRTA